MVKVVDDLICEDFLRFFKDESDYLNQKQKG